MKNITFIFEKNYDGGFCIGITPVWIHKHGGRLHFHILFNIGFWYFEIQIGEDEPK